MTLRHFMKDTPLISIVTPSFNQANFIGEALESVRLQKYENCEHLVIDGLSTDGTIDLLRHESSINRQQKLFWVSERDSGQSEALNKGFRQATGEIIGWLNSDDVYYPGAISAACDFLDTHPSVDKRIAALVNEANGHARNVARGLFPTRRGRSFMAATASRSCSPSAASRPSIWRPMPGKPIGWSP